MKFKVGDWVNSNGHICQITEIKPFTWDSNRIEIHTQYAVHMDTVELWQPKVGEWCWFFNNDRIPTISQLIEINEEITRKYFAAYPGRTRALASWYKRCEPFIGQLPSFLKEQ